MREPVAEVCHPIQYFLHLLPFRYATTPDKHPVAVAKVSDEGDTTNLTPIDGEDERRSHLDSEVRRRRQPRLDKLLVKDLFVVHAESLVHLGISGPSPMCLLET